jgi:RHS repeat-associated protein
VYQYDGRGNVSSLLDSNENVAASYRYDEFGRLLALGGSVEQPFQFSTKRCDQGAGLVYYGYRFYAPAIGRWMNRDPLGEAGGINLYGFVNNDPVNWVDPWGLKDAFNDWRYGQVSKCINQYNNDLAKCNDPCNSAKNETCKVRANIHFHNCMSNFYDAMDLNKDEKVDYWDDIVWLSMRGLYNLRTPPGTPFPPGFGDDGPGSTDPPHT